MIAKSNRLPLSTQEAGRSLQRLVEGTDHLAVARLAAGEILGRASGR